MTSGRWRRVEELFDRAMEVPAGQREAWVREACAGDADLAVFDGEDLLGVFVAGLAKPAIPAIEILAVEEGDLGRGGDGVLSEEGRGEQEQEFH